ncbi:hypothetical protein ACE6H2_020412 [Prunus campanulata]
MLSSDDGENDVFFDSVDLSSQESIVAKEEPGCSKLEYEIWMNEPPSVKERRESFLRKMGLAEFDSAKCGSVEMEMESGASSKMMGLQRLLECSGAASSSCISSSSYIEENLGCCRSEGDNQANLMQNELDRNLQDKLNLVSIQEAVHIISPSATDSSQREVEAPVEECGNSHEGRKKKESWWKQFINKKKRRGGKVVFEGSKPDTEILKQNRMKVQQNSKRCMEFAALCNGQEIHAHKGFIRAMKFSPDGQYLATGGEDGVVRIWCVTLTDASCNYLPAEGSFDSKLKKIKSGYRVIFPDKGFQIEESPLQEFHGHSSDVLDLAWSNSNCLISSSMDKTVRLWEVGCSQCLNVFHHNDYVTCIQFNPLNDNYFISGSIDGKVRVWGLFEKRVVDWADVRDVITAICYQPDGKGFVVGSITGTCHFYEVSGEYLQLVVQMHIHGRTKTSGNQITGIQFSQEKLQRVMITSEDSKIRIFEGVELKKKYKGLPKSGCQMSTSFTSNGKHIISVGEDSHVYLWDYDGFCVSSSKQIRSVKSCEHFFCEGVSVAVPWSGMRPEQRSLETASGRYCSRRRGHLEPAYGSRDAERFSLGSWLFSNGPCRGSATWPEEELPPWALQHQDHQHHHHNHPARPDTWGLVIVTAGCDGTIRTFHNYGLPVRL